MSRFILITTFRSKKEDHNCSFFPGNINKLNKLRNVDSCIMISSVLTCSVLEEYAHKTLDLWRKTHKSQEVPETYIIYKVPPQAVNHGWEEHALQPAKLPASHVRSSREGASVSHHTWWGGLFGDGVAMSHPCPFKGNSYSQENPQ